MVVGKNVTKPDFTAQALAPLLEMSPADIAAKIDPDSRRRGRDEGSPVSRHLGRD